MTPLSSVNSIYNILSNMKWFDWFKCQFIKQLLWLLSLKQTEFYNWGFTAPGCVLEPQTYNNYREESNVILSDLSRKWFGSTWASGLNSIYGYIDWKVGKVSQKSPNKAMPPLSVPENTFTILHTHLNQILSTTPYPNSSLDLGLGMPEREHWEQAWALCCLLV